MELNLADLFELVADEVPDATAMVSGERRLTYRDLDHRADRLAHHLAGVGVGAGERVGVQLANGTEYIEAMLACFKIRAVPVNVNYRYVTRELEYLYTDAGLVGLVFHRRFGAAVTGALGVPDRAPCRPRGGRRLATPSASASSTRTRWPDRPSGPGLPRPVGRRPLLRLHGRHHGHAQGRAVAPRRHLLRGHGWWRSVRLGRPHHPARGAGRAGAAPGVTALAIPPFMHAAGHWLAFSTLFGAARSSPRRTAGSTRSRRGAWWRPSGPTPSWWWATPWPAAARRPGRRSRPLRPVVADGGGLGRRRAVAIDQGPAGRAAAGPDRRRPVRLVGDGPGRRRAAGRRPLRAAAPRVDERTDRARRRPRAGGPRIGHRRPSGPRRTCPARLSGRPGRQRPPRSSRRPARLGAARRPGHGGRRRDDHRPRSGLAVHQHRRGEGLPRRGRGRAEGPSGTWPTPSWSARRRALRPTGRGTGAAARRARVDADALRRTRTSC